MFFGKDHHDHDDEPHAANPALERYQFEIGPQDADCHDGQQDEKHVIVFEKHADFIQTFPHGKKREKHENRKNNPVHGRTFQIGLHRIDQ